MNIDNTVSYVFLNSLASCSNAIIGFCVLLFFMIWTGLTASLIRNIRNKSFWKHTLCYFLLKPAIWVWNKIKMCFKKLADKIRYIITCDYSQGQGTKFKVIASAVCVVFVVLNFFILLFCGNQFDWTGWFFTIIMVFVNLAVIGFCLPDDYRF